MANSAAKNFAEKWKGRGYEKGESQKFWLSLLGDVFGVEHPDEFISFEDQVHLDHTSFIDGTITATKVLIEQKSLGKDLNKGIKQSDGTFLTPFQQAKRYITELPLSQHPRWVVTCNFAEFYVYDMERPNCEPEIIQLANLEKEYYRLQFLVDSGSGHLKREMEVSIAAGEIVGTLYDAFYNQYKHISEQELKDLNVLCVRLVFCLYAEDAEIFGRHGMFYDYLKQFDTKHTRKALQELFRVLDTKLEERDEYLEADLAEFPYVNGGLFAREDVIIPQFTDEIRGLLLEKASEDFNWAEISPTIFGAVFESTLNPETRRKGGMHYTSIENIHKVIDPLFLNDLKSEFEEICANTVTKTRDRKLRDFQQQLASLSFLDPACGSGNFLTETYCSLRRLENDILRILSKGQMRFADEVYSPIQVSISQFYGIEINDFAVAVAKTALWIAESQMMKETEDILITNLDFLPLKTNASIIEANALRIDWETVVPKHKLNYIMGNPPFVGKKEQSKEQKNDLTAVFDVKGVGNLDYVTGWYRKALSFINGTDVKCAFVSTNSITQGEQVAPLWLNLLADNLNINFAYRTFRWDSEATLKAHVHCVIIGFSTQPALAPTLYDSERKIIAHNISPYLVDAPSVIVQSRTKPICNAPIMQYGSMPIDDGHLILEKSDVDVLMNENPKNDNFIRKYVGGAELLNNKQRWCLWLLGVSPAAIKKSRFIMERVRLTEEFRRSSKRPQTLALASTPTLFGEIRQPDSEMLVVPKVSSETRRYIPICYVKPDIIVNGSALIMPKATLYHFGVLISNVHMAWMRTVAGRLETRYQYSANVVYNNFPWPDSTDEQKAKIEKTAKAILEARASYHDCSLADLYDELTMPAQLRKAHQNNDKAVMAAYGITSKDAAFTSESACVAELMKLYQKKTAEK